MTTSNQKFVDASITLLNQPTRTIQSEDIENILKGIEKILDIYAVIVDVISMPPPYISNVLAEDLKDQFKDINKP